MMNTFIILTVVKVYRCNLLEVIELYILNVYNLSYASYTSIMLFYYFLKDIKNSHRSEAQLTESKADMIPQERFTLFLMLRTHS